MQAVILALSAVLLASVPTSHAIVGGCSTVAAQYLSFCCQNNPNDPACPPVPSPSPVNSPSSSPSPLPLPSPSPSPIMVGGCISVAPQFKASCCRTNPKDPACPPASRPNPAALTPARVCSAANGLIGGYALLSTNQIAHDKNLWRNAKARGASVARRERCTLVKVTIKKACSQVVAGLNYRYSAIATVRCGSSKKAFLYANQFNVPLGK